MLLLYANHYYYKWEDCLERETAGQFSQKRKKKEILLNRCATLLKCGTFLFGVLFLLTGKNYLDTIKKIQSIQMNISPNQLYKHVLFIEKQGFTQLLKESNILNELNLGLICSQGFATRSSKKLIRYFNKAGIKVYCLHDCDLSGYNIKHNISNKSKTFKHDLEIEDIGIKVADVKKYNKLPEVYYSKTDYSNSKEKLNLTEFDYSYLTSTTLSHTLSTTF